MSVEATVLPAAMLGISGLVVLAAGEYGGELELLVETSESVTGCPRCGVVAVAHGRREHLVRDIPSAGRPVAIIARYTRANPAPRAMKFKGNAPSCVKIPAVRVRFTC